MLRSALSASCTYAPFAYSSDTAFEVFFRQTPMIPVLLPGHPTMIATLGVLCVAFKAPAVIGIHSLETQFPTSRQPSAIMRLQSTTNLAVSSRQQELRPSNYSMCPGGCDGIPLQSEARETRESRDGAMVASADTPGPQSSVTVA